MPTAFTASWGEGAPVVSVGPAAGQRALAGASADASEDLFWPLRGEVADFGVVTSIGCTVRYGVRYRFAIAEADTLGPIW